MVRGNGPCISRKRSDDGNKPLPCRLAPSSLLLPPLSCVLLVAVLLAGSVLMCQCFVMVSNVGSHRVSALLTASAHSHAPVAASRVQVSRTRSGDTTSISNPEEDDGSASTRRTTTSTPTKSAATTSPSTTGGGGDLQDLKASVDIVAVIESYNLPKYRRSGTGAVGCCPFHDDTNPSLGVDANRQMYKCFSCGAGGDVIKFAQEYSRLPGQVELSFGQVIQFLDTEFGDGTFTINDNKYESKVPPEEREKERIRRERCLHANEVAATYFSDALTQLSSGAARMYLRSRNVSPLTTRVFGIGFACNNRKGLVTHLMSHNFTATEIIDAGLAIVKNKEMRQLAGVPDDLNISDIVDKFNNRLMVPIMDGTGKKVLGFGGRVITSETETEIIQSPSSSTFKAPKYLNSPETPVFSKSNILFGIFIAKNSIDTVAAVSTKRPTIVLVEGYMDAISLWGAGYHTVAATMGTAVSQYQLDSAAKVVTGMGGRVVLCLDNDKAGIAAMERLCCNGMLSKVSSKYKVDVVIASLPARIKDPGDYAERYRGDKAFAEKFEREVIDTASDWIKWYISSIIRQYDKNAPRGTLNSFGSIFSRVGEFIGTTLDPADRTKAALDVSHQLSDLLKIDRNSTEISRSVQIQLEADLIDVAARHSHGRNELPKRADQFSSNSVGSKMGMSNLRHGDLYDEMAANGNALSPVRTSAKKISDQSSVGNKKANRSRRIMTMERPKRVEKSLTPFFAGFDFSHKTDAEWLGTATNAPAWKKINSLVLGHPDPDNLASSTFGQAVYFNSMAFNGDKFLASEAEKAGYTRARRRPDKSVVEYGIASIVDHDFAQVSETVEDIVLRTLVEDVHARQTARDFLNSRPSFTDHDIVWSHPNKKWLFQKLVYSESMALPCEKTVDTRCRLMRADDVPLNAFLLDEGTSRDDTKESLHETGRGNLDHLFEASLSTDITDGCFDFRITEDRHDLLLQENLSKLLWVSASLRVESIRDKLRDSPLHLPYESEKEQNLALAVEIGNETEPFVSVVPPESSMMDMYRERDMLIQANKTNYSLELVESLRDAVSTANSLKQSSNRITVNIMDQSFSDGVGPNSLSVRKRLVDDVAEHIEKNVTFAIPSIDFSDNDGDYYLSQVMEHDEPFEDGLERIGEEWGDWLDDDYVWSSSDSETSRSKAVAAFLATKENKVATQVDVFEEESLEDFNARIGKEYKAWV